MLKFEEEGDECKLISNLISGKWVIADLKLNMISVKYNVKNSMSHIHTHKKIYVCVHDCMHA